MAVMWIIVATVVVALVCSLAQDWLIHVGRFEQRTDRQETDHLVRAGDLVPGLDPNTWRPRLERYRNLAATAMILMLTAAIMDGAVAAVGLHRQDSAATLLHVVLTPALLGYAYSSLRRVQQSDDLLQVMAATAAHTAKPNFGVR